MRYEMLCGDMVKLVDTLVLEASAERCGSSSLPVPTYSRVEVK